MLSTLRKIKDTLRIEDSVIDIHIDTLLSSLLHRLTNLDLDSIFCNRDGSITGYPKDSALGHYATVYVLGETPLASLINSFALISGYQGYIRLTDFYLRP